ncbi:hypothetical protein C8Q78DRAFT_976510 [Trametes maxima]|nr:hypothetical protein C8Q78DRAFT_976510 [Trametes maxima]
MLYAPHRICTNPQCSAPRLLRHKDIPARAVVFTRNDGVCEARSVHLYCYSCQTNYHHDYSVHRGVRSYYEGLPSAVQVAEHIYVERDVLEFFLTLTVLSWTSATNAAQIYHEAFSRLEPGDRDNPRYRLRTEHVWDGFIINSLLKDACDRHYVLQVPHIGNQKDRFTAAMQARNEYMRRSGQPEFAHWCTKCHRRYDNDDGSTDFSDAIVIDGIDMGRPCCGVCHCTGELLSTQDHFCPQHWELHRQCAVEGCNAPKQPGRRVCTAPDHVVIEDWYKLHGKGMFTLAGRRAQRARVAHPPDALASSAAVDEIITVEVTCPSKPDVGNRTLKANFGRRRTHNEQLAIRPCGIILYRETFPGSETVTQTLDMVRKRHQIPGSMPCYIHYDCNCILYQHSQARGETLHEEVGLPVDVFHWKCKHKRTNDACAIHCNPYNYRELLADDGSWFFNSSVAEQTNVWFGGYHSIIREMGCILYDFFLDEVIKEKNRITRERLLARGCLPGYREFRFTHTD